MASDQIVIGNGNRLRLVMDIIKIVSVLAAILWSFADLKSDVRIMANDISKIKADVSRLEALHFGVSDGH